MQGPELLIPAHLEIAHIPCTEGGPYPGVFLFAGMARWARPVQNLAQRGLELIGSLEQATLDIRCALLRSAQRQRDSFGQHGAHTSTASLGWLS